MMSLWRCAPKPRGFGLAALLIVIPVLLLLLLALFAALTQSSRWTGSYQGQIAAGYAAEAGAADALQKLRDNPAWVTGFDRVTMVGGRGAYSITFNQSNAGFADDQSVNNFDGKHSDSFLGPGTVPSGTALLAVVGQVGAYQKRSFFLIGTGDSTLRVEHSLLTSGRIKLRGDSRFRSVESIAEEGDLKAKVQSNNQGDDPDMISWRSGLAGGGISIDGEVRSSGSSSDAIDLDGYEPTGGISINAAQVQIPPAGIEAHVFSKRGAAALTSGATTVPSGDSYQKPVGGLLEIPGDLVLDGDLYIEGSLKVIGSIRGRGSVYVTGNTEFHGDSTINAKNKVAVLSKGHVTLKGFDGDKYLDTLASSDDEFSDWLDDARWATAQLQAEMSGGEWERQDVGPDNVDGFLSVLAPGDFPEDRESDFGTDRQGATLVRMRERLEGLAEGSTRNFMIEKLDEMTRLFSPNSNVLMQSESETAAAFFDHGVTAGIVEAANDHQPSLQPAAYNVVRQLNFDRLGSAYFQGLIYTNGAFYADNQVTILGAVAVSDDGSQSALDADVNPGDLVLNGGSSVTYVKDFFFGPNAAQPGPRRILLHLGDG